MLSFGSEESRKKSREDPHPAVQAKLRPQTTRPQRTVEPESNHVSWIEESEIELEFDRGAKFLRVAANYKRRMMGGLMGDSSEAGSETTDSESEGGKH